MKKKYLLFIIIFSVFLLSKEAIYAQTPGGVGSNLKTWLKANAGVTTSGGTVSAWADQSGGGFSATQATLNKQPGYTSNSLLFNNYPSLDFDLIDDAMSTTAVINTRPYSFFVVYNSTSSSTAARRAVQGSNNWLMGPYGNRARFYAGAFIDPNTIVPTIVPAISTATSSAAASANAAFYYNGKTSGTGTATGVPGTIYLGAYSPITTEPMGGSIAEVIAYTSTVSAVEKNRIESYLALKYGITLDQTLANDYVNSSGTVVYPSATTHSGFAKDVTGIIRDDASGLNQASSRSMNKGSVVGIESPAALNNGEYFITGDNGSAIDLRSTDAPAGYGQRLQRVWRVSKSANPTTVTLKLDVSDIGELLMSTSNLSSVALLINNSNSFAAATPVTGTLTGTILEFTGVTLNDGDYFTLSLGNQTLPTTYDFEFWFGVPQWNATWFTPQKLHFTGVSDTQSATYIIDMPADPGFTPITGIVPPNTARIIDMSSLISAITVQPTNTVVNRGLRIRVNGQMGAYYANENASNYGTMPLRGPNALGTSFIIPGQDTFSNSQAWGVASSMFVVTATEDNTVVTITPSQAIIGHGANVPFTVNLNKGQSYSAQATASTGNHLAGSFVTSTNPVVVTYMDDLLGFGGAADNSGDQLVPIAKLGLEYVHLRANLNNNGELAYIFGSEDGTTVTIFDGTTTTTLVVNKGGLVKHLLPTGKDAASIKADKPVMVYKMGGYNTELGGGVLTPIADCKGTKAIAFQYPTVATQAVFNFVAPNTILNGFSLNGNTTLIQASDFTAIPGITGWSYCRKTVTGVFTAGEVVSIKNTLGKFYFYQNMFSGGGGDYSNFSDFGNVVLFPKTAHTCATNTITLNNGAIAFNSNITGYSWTGPNGFTSTQPSPVLTNPTAVNAGTYVLTVTDNTGCTHTENLIVDLPIDSITLTPNPSAPCVGSTVQFTSVAIPAGAVPNSVSWTGPNGFTSTQANFEIASITAAHAGTYTCTYVDKYGCSVTNNVTITVSPSVVSSFAIGGGRRLNCANPTATLSATGFSPGLEYDTYQSYNAVSLFASSDFNVVTDGFYNEQPTNSGVASQMNLAGLTGISGSSVGYGVKYKGFIDITTAGNYTFYTNSHDGSNLYIDGSLRVSNDGSHANTEIASDAINLSVGRHSIEANYFQSSVGASLLSVSYAGPSIAKQVIPAGVLFHPGGAPPALSYVWSPGGQTTQSISVSAPGTYTVTGSNGGCSSVATFTVEGIDSYDYSDKTTPWPVAQAKVTNCIVAGVPTGSNNSVWAGLGVSTEPAPLRNATASADTFDDGFIRPTGSGNIFNVILNSNASGTTVHYGLWFDWNNNGNFADDVDGNGNPAFYSGSAVTASPVTVPVTVIPPTGVTGLYTTRLIVADIPVVFTAFDDIFNNGEVEDDVSVLLLSGTVFTDANGLSGVPANTVDGTGTNAGGLVAILVNSSGNVVANATVGANGAYSFASLAPDTYSIVLSTAAGTIGSAPPSPSLPSGWVNTGENLGVTAGNDGTANGILVNIVVSATNVGNANFGINSKPTANPLTSCLVDSGGQLIVPVLTGSDVQDGTYNGISNTNKITIVTLPAAAVLYYNGTATTVGQVISNYNPSLLTIDFNAGSYSTSFTFNEIDAAGSASAAATVTLSTAYAGPDTSTDQMVPITMAAVGTGSWTVNPGNPGAVTPFSDINSPTTQISGFDTDGIYSYTWTNTNGCSDIVLVTVPVVPPIVANDDTGITVNGFVGGASLANILTNDTLDGNPILAADVNITVVGVLPNGISLTGTDGTTVEVAPGTPAGSYSLVYRICEKIRPTNCDQATVTVTVTAPVIDAVDDDYSATFINGASGGTTASVLTNDTLNGASFTPSAVTLTTVGVVPTGLTLNTSNGIITVAAGTPAGSYALTYSICENLNPGNCDTATATVVVSSISLSGTIYDDGDGLNGVPANTINGTGTNAGGLMAILVGSNGNVAANTTVALDGTYSFAFIVPDTYSVLLSTTAGTIGNTPPSAGLPLNWFHTAEKLGTGAGNDGTVDGIVTTIIVNTTDVVNANFGIDSRPVADAVTFCQTNPGGTTELTIPALTGSDLEDGIYTGVSNTNTISIETLPVNGILYYNGIAVTAGQVISNYNPALLTLDPDNGTLMASFTFNEIDAAGISSTPAVVNVFVSLAGNITGTQNICVGATTTFASDGDAGGAWTTSNAAIATVNATGLVTGIAAGTATITYTVTGIGGCANATATRTVTICTTPIDAVADDYSATLVNGTEGGTLPSVLTNDTLNGQPVKPTDVTLTGVTVPTGMTLNPDGTITIAPGTTPGTYPLTYTICEILNPTNCNTVTSTIVVVVPAITIVKSSTFNDTNGDGEAQAGETITYSFTVSNTGTVSLSDIKVNDPMVTVSGGPISLAPGTQDNTSFKAVYTLTQADTNAGEVNNIAMVSGTDPSGSVILKLSDSNDPLLTGPEDPTVTLLPKNVKKPAIAIVKTGHFNDDNGDGYAQAGETVTFSFTVTNTGNVDLTNVSVSDTDLPGLKMMGSPIPVLGIGTSNSTTYSATYAITQANINAGSITNQASARGTSPAGTIVSDLSDDSDTLGDNPTVLTLTGCVIEVFNAVSPNSDNSNDVFYIRGLECYPDNTVQIYNRWGVLVFERDHYNNSDRAFRGISEGRSTINKSEKLPVGTYFYILKYKNDSAIVHEKSGYLYINRK